jgi:hypothetical protein
MTREPIILVAATLLLGGCATIVHGPYQDVRIDSNPPGATATISAQLSERGPAFVDETKERKVTTPATVRLLRDNTYRVEMEKPGYKIVTTQIVSEYDWLWGQLTCGPCEAVGALPSYDEELKDQNVALRFVETAFYEYPKGFIGAWGKGLRLFSPDAHLGSTFKLKEKDSGYWSGWHGLGTPEISATLEPQ